MPRPYGLNRRRFLQGVGACVALPLFESLGSVRLLADPVTAAQGKLAVTATGAPLRAAFLFFPNGAIPALVAASQPNEKGGAASFQSISVSTASGGVRLTGRRADRGGRLALG